MQYGRFAVDYEYRPYNPERMRNERIARAQAALKKHGLGAMILYDYDYHRYLGYYSFHQYARRRLGTFVLLIQGQGLPYVPIDHLNGQWERPRMPWFEGKMALETSKAYQLIQGLPDNPDFMPGYFDKTAQEIKALLKKHDVLDLPCGIDIASQNMLDACKRAGIKIVDGNTCMVDGCTVSPRKSRRKSACFSSTTTSTPARASRKPSIMPAGPPPAMQQRAAIALTPA